MNPKVEAWINENPEVEEWLTSVTKSAAEIYSFRFHAFYLYLTESGQFEGYTPAMLLDFQDNARGRERVIIANRLGLFLQGLGSRFRPKTLTHYYSSTRSFFAYHGCDLPKRGFTLPDDHREPSPQNLTRDDMVNIVGAARLRDKTIYTIVLMGGLGWNEFNQFNHGWEEIGPQLESGQDYIKFDLKARKKHKGLTNGFYTIVGKDGVDLLRKHMEKRGEPKEGEGIFMTKTNTNLVARTYRKNFEYLCRRVGLINHQGQGRTSRYGYSPHMVRDIYRTMFQRSGADSDVAEFCLGHNVDSNRYLQFIQIPEYVIEQYKIAEPLLSIVTNPDPNMVHKDEVQYLKNELTRMKTGRNDEMESLRNEVQEMKQMMAYLYENPQFIEEYKKKRKI